MSYTIKLPQFEGPFDLLLFFIERDELDIYNIPIASITNDFLDYIRQMEALNIDLASEFILVAATLMRIKAKLLLPRKELDELGQEIDPRQELVDRLIEYKRYKDILEELKGMEESRALKEERGNVTRELKKIATKALVDSELESLTLFKLLKAFEKVLQRFEEESKVVKHTVIKYNFTLVGQKAFLTKLISEKKKIDFQELFTQSENRMHAIFTFLALLEMLQTQDLDIIDGLGVNNFWITEKQNDE